MCLFEYSTSIEERKEEKAMLKILNELGQMKGHFAVEIFDLENFGLGLSITIPATARPWKAGSVTVTAWHWIKIHQILE